ncbi:MAG: peptidylprolyl isomerase [Taibaiella sp.]|nr:peptidylprolyl isomerase [Taibaiella sp.]
MLTSEIVVTPEEVKKAYEELGPEQLPYISATVEIGQIIINPEASDEVEQYTKEKLEDVRQQIVTGEKDFSIMAGILSEDPGSRDNGGLVEIENKENFDATFASVAFRLNEGDVSPVFRSSFGYHIIKMERKGNSTATVRHILMVPAVTSVDIQEKMDYLDSVKKELEAGKITYGQAVAKLSNDELAKGRSGMMFDFNTGSTQLTLDQLDEQYSIHDKGHENRGILQPPCVLESL